MTWTCGDCGATYDDSVRYCPDVAADRAAVQALRGVLCDL
jgi:hypothetical protein